MGSIETVAGGGSLRAREPAQKFGVVGVGASAGGLDAFGQLLEALPVETGLAYLLVQHLDPRHPSALVELLALKTRMPVAEARSGEPLAPDHVYIAPPNFSMTVVDRMVVLAPRPSVGPHLPIDELFCSLALDQPGAAIGVVLSGNGGDGTRGVEAIKAAGGLTFAQDEGSAAFPAMPHNAVGGGHIDRVAPPSEIAHAIGAVIGASFPLGSPSLPLTDDPGPVLAMVRASHGVDFAPYRQSALERRIRRRMVLAGVTDYHAYASMLEGDPDEIEALYDDILINVTAFFRDAPMFEALRTVVFPSLFAGKEPGATIRMWVPACSTGQEAYSLLMLLHEYLDGRTPRPVIQVFATDLSERASLQKARDGLYPETISSEVSPDRLARFFTKIDGHYRVGKVLRESVVFARHDVATDPPFSHMDLVSCRNLLIYMSPTLQQRVISTLHYALEPGGVLVLGGGETIGFAADLFTVIDQRHRLYAKRSTPQRHPRHYQSPATPIGHARSGASKSTNWKAEADRVALAEYVPPGVLVTADLDVIEFRGDTSPFLAPPPGEPSTQLLRLAREGLFLELRQVLDACRQTRAPTRRDGVTFSGAAGPCAVDLRVLPVSIDEGSEPAFLVLFHPHAAPPSPPTWVPRWVRSLPPWSRGRTADVTRLEAELATTRAYLQTVIEDHDAAHDVLLAANEEVQSGNEELQSTNEELETAKEELQSVNEELLTVNEQLHGRNNDLMALSDDLTNLLGSAVVSMVALDGALAIRRFTPAAAQVLGLRQSDVGRPLQSLALPIGAPDLPEVCAQVAVHDGVVEREVRHDGGRWYTLRVHPYRATDGHTDGAVVVLVDIDDAKRAQDQLRDARDYVTAIVETVRHPLVVLDGELRVQSANRAFYQRFRLTAGACEGERVSSLGVEWLEGSAGASLLERLWRGDTLVDHEVAHGAGPERRTWSVNGRRLVGAGEPRVLLAIEDVSDARRLAAELELRATELAAADARKNEFLAVLAHELRNPLVPIRNGLEILRLSDGDPPTVHRTHRMLERQVRHMTRLVDDLLDVSRIGLGRITLRRRQVDLCAVVRQLVELEQPLIERASHQVEVSTPPEGVVVYADPVRLDQIVDNLLANAIKYTDPGGHIRITVSAEGGTASLEVADDGVGISAELEPRLWDLFSQADWTADRGGGGLGIGLALVRRLVGLHGGSVEAHSDGAGTGSRFVVHLPLSPHPFEVDVSEADIPRVVGGAPGRRVLVVDDDLDVAQSMATLLELMGHEVRVAHDGAGALAAMADPTPEVVFLDIGMAGVSGLEVARLIRAGHRFGRPYLVALTGYGAAEDLARTHAAGFDLHLVKPVEPARLEEVLASLPTTLGVR